MSNENNWFTYTKGPVGEGKPGKRMRQYNNLYADLLAGSVYSAIARATIKWVLTREMNCYILYVNVHTF